MHASFLTPCMPCWGVSCSNTTPCRAQTLLDECPACEEHFGSTDWVLSDRDPELTQLTGADLASRRAGAPAGSLEPSAMPATLINLQVRCCKPECSWHQLWPEAPAA